MTTNESKGLVKILGDGELVSALTVRAHKFTESARAKIEAAGGTVEIIPTKVYEKTKRRRDEFGKKVPPPQYRTCRDAIYRVHRRRNQSRPLMPRFIATSGAFYSVGTRCIAPDCLALT